MRNSLNLFRSNITEARNLTALYDYLEVSMKSPLSFDDLLRSQIVYSVSAFDKLIHDIIRIGMVEIFIGRRLPTPAYLAESISISIHNELITATIPPPAYIFEQAIFRKLKTISYQEPGKIAEGLSYIWEEKQKWQKISNDSIERPSSPNPFSQGGRRGAGAQSEVSCSLSRLGRGLG
jgi:hypothetical protein